MEAMFQEILGGVKIGNKSYAKYYSNPGFKMGKI